MVLIKTLYRKKLSLATAIVRADTAINDKKPLPLESPTIQSGKIFSDSPMVAFRRRPTLNDILTSSFVQYPYQPSKIKKLIPKVCLKMAGKCNHCPNISKKDHIVCTRTKFSFNMLPRPTKGYYTCKLSNIIYCITCSKCSKQYIGQSSRALHHRIYEHKYSVLNPLTVKTSVSKHFTSKCDGVKDMVFSVVEWIPKDPVSSKSFRLFKPDDVITP